VTWFARPDTIVTAADLDPLTGERVPERWLDRRPTVSDFCAANSVPAIAEMNRYDQRGRVILPPAYARWFRSPDNWLRTSEVALSATPNPASSNPASSHRASSALAHSPSLHITSPLAGSTLILDPDLPGGGRRLPLRASSPLAAPLWSSPSLAIDHQGRSATATLTPGQHEIRLHDPGTGQTTTTSITVRSL
jgi:penicillin-binding protein 1C